MNAKEKEKADRVYYCLNCSAKFSGTGCRFRVHDHEEFTGHKMLKAEQVLTA